ncbi:RsmB/NOP family class I SAM-dependent RNA methyltransferase [Vandammella animalimorsus]|uniref:RsmB/NOP family class I SAM-dependent RNA methyltransferase n=1 Tax=Vandammella animalimorsus TaxID=2029117 RepID=UPI00325BC2C9
MPPRFLISTTGALLQRIARFEEPADAVLLQFLKTHPKLGVRERQQLGNAAFTALRFWRLLQYWARLGSTPQLPDTQHFERLALLSHALLAQYPQQPPTPPAQINQAGQPMAPPISDALALAVLQQARDWVSQWPHEDGNASLQWLEHCTEALQAESAPGQQASALPLACQHNLPDWLAEKLLNAYGTAHFWPLMHALRQSAPLDLRVNLLAHKRQVVQHMLQEQGIACEPTPHSPWGLRLPGKPSLRQNPLMHNGTLEVQDEGSQLLALLSEAKRGETVVDFCAGAGGKTLALGAMMRDSGRLYAFDTSSHRLARLQPRLQRSGLHNVHTMVLQSEADTRLQRLHGKVDRVLVDAPCSGLGTLRRHPDLAWHLPAEEIPRLQALQLRILSAAAALLKPGGHLIYATCSLLPDENEAVCQLFASKHPQFVQESWPPLLEKHGLAHLQPNPNTLPSRTQGLMLLPHLHQTDGFFIARWRRQG